MIMSQKIPILLKKDTNEKIMCMADGNIEEFEKISGINFEKLN